MKNLIAALASLTVLAACAEKDTVAAVSNESPERVCATDVIDGVSVETCICKTGTEATACPT